MPKRSDLKTVGEMLQQARQAREMSLEAVAEVTKIPVPLLQAVEMDQFDKLSGPLYVRSFLQTFAKCVGLDPRMILDRYNRQVDAGGGPNGERETRDGEVWEEDVEIQKIGVRIGPKLQRSLVGIVVLAVLVIVTLRFTGGGQNEPGGPQDRELAAGESGDRSAASQAALQAAADPVRTGLPDPMAEQPPARPVTEPTTQKEDRTPAAVDRQERQPGARQDGQQTGGQADQPADRRDDRQDGSTDDEQTWDRMQKSEPEVTEILQPEPMTPQPMTPQPMTPQPMTPQRLPAAHLGDESLVFDNGATRPLVLRVLCNGVERVKVQFRQFGQPQAPTITLPGDARTPLPASGIVTGKPYKVREGAVIYYSAGSREYFELRLSSKQGVQVHLNGHEQRIPNSVVDRWWLLDRSKLPEP